MKKHIHRIHERHKDHKCDSCGKTSEASKLRRHIQAVQEGSKDHKCAYCGKSLSQAGNLTVHTKTLHSDPGTSYKCESSSKLFSQAKYLKKHIQDKCEYCGKFFSQAKNLEKHIQTIHKLCQKEHKCKFCDKSFSHITEQLIGTESPCHVGTLLKEHIQKFHVDIDKKDNDSENLLHHRDPK